MPRLKGADTVQGVPKLQGEEVEEVKDILGVDELDGFVIDLAAGQQEVGGLTWCELEVMPSWARVVELVHVVEAVRAVWRAPL